MNPEPGYDATNDMAIGRSKDVDVDAIQAAKEAKVNRDFKVVPEDMAGGSSGQEPQGNR